LSVIVLVDSGDGAAIFARPVKLEETDDHEHSTRRLQDTPMSKLPGEQHRSGGDGRQLGEITPCS
jgi:hypothetical protein